VTAEVIKERRRKIGNILVDIEKERNLNLKIKPEYISLKPK